MIANGQKLISVKDQVKNDFLKLNNDTLNGVASQTQLNHQRKIKQVSSSTISSQNQILKMRKIFRETQKKHNSNQISTRDNMTALGIKNKINDSIMDQSVSNAGMGPNGTYLTTTRDPKDANQIKKWVNKVTNRLMQKTKSTTFFRNQVPVIKNSKNNITVNHENKTQLQPQSSMKNLHPNPKQNSNSIKKKPRPAALNNKMINVISNQIEVPKPQTTRSSLNKDKFIIQGLSKMIGLKSYKMTLKSSQKKNKKSTVIQSARDVQKIIPQQNDIKTIKHQNSYKRAFWEIGSEFITKHLKLNQSAQSDEEMLRDLQNSSHFVMNLNDDDEKLLHKGRLFSSQLVEDNDLLLQENVVHHTKIQNFAEYMAQHGFSDKTVQQDEFDFQSIEDEAEIQALKDEAKFLDERSIINKTYKSYQANNFDNLEKQSDSNSNLMCPANTASTNDIKLNMIMKLKI
ncbi:UNKNOWN [Stylonychia lemnae]|uniref:Uncharacterized protein n=1 Tax=Stylonychia lemnae TaxID=5949 RepID=A0A078BE10_STYLE|nr:UNKNOWN [Stylonychia lemnae]|eukprot:CDW91818.1 UNKNOWN [Stylonychia lemnae]